MNFLGLLGRSTSSRFLARISAAPLALPRACKCPKTIAALDFFLEAVIAQLLFFFEWVLSVLYLTSSVSYQGIVSPLPTGNSKAVMLRVRLCGQSVGIWRGLRGRRQGRRGDGMVRML